MPAYRTALYNLAFLSYKIGQVDRAFNNLLTLHKHYSDHANGMHLLGDCYMNKGQLDNAIKSYSACLKINPSHVLALHNLGQLTQSI